MCVAEVLGLAFYDILVWHEACVIGATTSLVYHTHTHITQHPATARLEYDDIWWIVVKPLLGGNGVTRINIDTQHTFGQNWINICV